MSAALMNAHKLLNHIYDRKSVSIPDRKILLDRECLVERCCMALYRFSNDLGIKDHALCLIGIVGNHEYIVEFLIEIIENSVSNRDDSYSKCRALHSLLKICLRIDERQMFKKYIYNNFFEPKEFYGYLDADNARAMEKILPDLSLWR